MRRAYLQNYWELDIRAYLKNHQGLDRRRAYPQNYWELDMRRAYLENQQGLDRRRP